MLAAKLGVRMGSRLGATHDRELRREAFAPGQHQADGGFERLGGAGFRQQAAHGLGQAEFGQRRRHVFGQHQHALRLQPLAQAGQAEPASFRVGGQAVDQQIGVVRPRIGFMQGLGIDIDQIAGVHAPVPTGGAGQGEEGCGSSNRMVAMAAHFLLARADAAYNPLRADWTCSAFGTATRPYDRYRLLSLCSVPVLARCFPAGPSLGGCLPPRFAYSRVRCFSTQIQIKLNFWSSA